MSRIEDLIQDLCPEGVMYFPLTSVARIDRGLTYQKSDEDPNGSIAVLRSNNIDQASNTISLTDVKKLRSDLTPNPKTRLSVGDILISAASGSATHVGKVAFIARDPEAYFGGFMMAVRSGNLIENSYLFHILTSRLFRDYLDQTLSSSTINNINAAVLDGFKLPVPPLEVQKEIVSILDKFTQLEAELEAELEARRFQYEYYRNKLLTFTELETL
jgi:type I restriction enzyme S subunit